MTSHAANYAVGDYQVLDSERFHITTEMPIKSHPVTHCKYIFFTVFTHFIFLVL